ncbi:MAG: hypothetical protein M3N29_02680 [Chloroflexota bacterium]|nr:hypothetical protein [Chloroflexota bacterium]
MRSVAQDPRAVMSELGIPVTAKEAEELAEMIRQEPRARLSMYGAREHEQFGGLWVNDGGFDVVMLFTADLERHRRIVAALAPTMRVDVRRARFTEAELRRLQDELVGELDALPELQFLSLGLDTKNNVLRLEAKSNDPTIKQRLEEQYGGRLVVNVHSLPGPWANAEGGPGWRLLAAGISRGGGVEPYSVRVATSDAEWQQLWSETDRVNPRPEIDPAQEIAVLFAEGIGSSCPEVRLDGVVIDHASRLVHSVTSDPFAPRACTADLVGAAFFVVALSRDALPESPFTVRLSEQHDEGVEVDLRP